MPAPATSIDRAGLAGAKSLNQSDRILLDMSDRSVLDMSDGIVLDQSDKPQKPQSWNPC